MIRKRTFPWFGRQVTDNVARDPAGRDFMRGIRDGAVLSPSIAGEIRHAKVGRRATGSTTCLVSALPAA